MLHILLKAIGLGWLMPAPFSSISVDQAHSMATTGEITLVDIRNEKEWNQTGRPINSIGLTLNTGRWESDILNLLKNDKSKPIALSCLHGPRSVEAAYRLHEAGYEKVFNVEGGMTAWLNAGLPVSNSPF